MVGGCALDPAGCCDGVGRLLYCVGKDLYCIDCPGSFPACGWAANGPGASAGSYDCGTAGGQDPSGTHPKSCSACAPKCAGGAACSAECPGTCGKCGKNGELCLDDGTCYQPKCADKECGLDPLGFSCGTCGPGLACEPGLQKCLPVPAACQGKKAPGCGGCGCETCVCTKHPFCCSVAWDAFCAAACASECGYSCKPCPAKPTCDGLGCGEFCGLQCGKCGVGQTCYKYQCCQMNCGGKVCGDDGCGGLCGTCSGTDECVAGKCEKCQPKCQDKLCGPDGCGGTCGACKGTDVCVQGQCAQSLCTGQCGAGGPQKTPEGKDCYCDDACKGYGDCCPGACAACPTLKGCCEPSCAGKECGDDGCGGVCGKCANNGSCEAGKCTTCKLNCEGKQCGPDGCGGECGKCSDGGTCEAGKCAACQPKCTGVECGDDGCKGSCGDCPKGKTCTAGKCICPPSGTTVCCGNSVCPIDTCGGVGAPLYPCSENCVDGECAAKCVPSCVGKGCGSDGCGGTCGQCPSGYTCAAGSCVGDALPDAGPAAADTSALPKATGAGTSASGGCSAGSAGGRGGVAALLLGTALAIATWRRRFRRAALPRVLAAVWLGACGGTAAPAPNSGADAVPDIPADVAPLTDTAAPPGDASPADAATVPDSLAPDAAGDASAEVDAAAPADVGADLAADASSVDVAEPATLGYDCANLPPGPFVLEAVPGAIASEDIAFDNKGNLIGSNNAAIFRTKAGAKGKLWIPGVDQRAGMRFLPDGKLAVCDDKLGRILLFDEDGAQTVLVQGLSYPNGITTDLKGFIYVTEHDAGRVLRIHPYTGKYTVLTKQIQNPNGIIFNPEFTHLYIGSFGSGYIYKLAVSPDGVPGKLIAWATPIGPGGLLDGIGVDACGNVYVCEYGNTDIWRIPPSGGPAVKIVDANPDVTYLPNMQWGAGKGWDPLSLYIPDGWKIGVWRVSVGVASAPRPFP